MKKVSRLSHRFVDFIPDELQEGVLYVALEYGAVVHKCCCGCGTEVNTPLTPTDWKLTFDGETVSLSPSVGNHDFACQSHYWIKRGKVEWYGKWSREQVAAGKKKDQREKQKYFAQQPESASTVVDGYAPLPAEQAPAHGFWAKFWMRLRSKWKR